MQLKSRDWKGIPDVGQFITCVLEAKMEKNMQHYRLTRFSKYMSNEQPRTTIGADLILLDKEIPLESSQDPEIKGRCGARIPVPRWHGPAAAQPTTGRITVAELAQLFKLSMGSNLVVLLQGQLHKLVLLLGIPGER